MKKSPETRIGATVIVAVIYVALMLTHPVVEAVLSALGY